MPFLLFPTAASAVQMCIVVLQTPAACLKDKGKASEVNWPDCGDWVSRNSPIMENVRHVLRFPLFSQMSLPLLTSVGIPMHRASALLSSFCWPKWEVPVGNSPSVITISVWSF